MIRRLLAEIHAALRIWSTAPLSLAAAEAGDLLLVLFDAEHGIRPPEQALFTDLAGLGRPMVAALNKIDLVGRERAAGLPGLVATRVGPVWQLTHAASGRRVAAPRSWPSAEDAAREARELAGDINWTRPAAELIHDQRVRAVARMLEQGEFLESALVHGNHYATSARWINEQRAASHDILLEIDWQGADQVRRLIPETIGIFILPPSFEALVSRLNKRAQDSPQAIARRLAAARDEISHAGEFKYVIINDNFTEAARDLISIVRARRLLTPVQLARHSSLINRMKQGI